MRGLLADLERWNAHGGIMVTVVEARGSTPREPGTYMIVGADGTRASGTIGGGALEHRALAKAGEMLQGDTAALMADIPLGPELGQCCGGHVTLLLERLPVAIAGEGTVVVTELAAPYRRWLEEDRHGVARGCIQQGTGGQVRQDGARRLLLQPAGSLAQPLAIFGAGHVGQAIVRAMAPLPFAIRWVDNRTELFQGFDAVGDVECVGTAAPADQVDHLAPGSCVLIMTHSHALDFDILRRALGRDDLGYVGLIGSATKRAKFIKKLQAYGVGAAAIDRLVCPIGLPGIAGKDPAVIAASVAADLLVRSERARAGQVAKPSLRVVS